MASTVKADSAVRFCASELSRGMDHLSVIRGPVGNVNQMQQATLARSHRIPRPRIDVTATRSPGPAAGRSAGITDCWRISSPISRWRRQRSRKVMSGPVPQYCRTVK